MKISGLQQKRAFVSALVGSVATLALITLIALQWSAAGQQQAAIASLSAQMVAQRQSDTLAMANASIINAEFNAAYMGCGCNSTYSGWSSDQLGSLSWNYLSAISSKMSDNASYTQVIGVSSAVTGSNTCVYTGPSEVLPTFQSTYVVESNSTRAAIETQVTQVNVLNVTSIPNHAFNMTVFQNGNIVAAVNVSC
jgi:hypothetical protein